MTPDETPTAAPVDRPKARPARMLTVGKATELPPGSRRIVEDGDNSIGVFNIRGKFYAIRNLCPHQGAPLCQGTVQAVYRPSGAGESDPALKDRVIRCPWHGWEFDIVSGKGLFDLRSRIDTYEVRIDAEENVLVIL